MTEKTPAMISVDDGYCSSENLNHAIQSGTALISFSDSKGQKLLGDDIYESENYQLARNLRSISEAGISKFKNYHNLARYTVCGIKRVRQQTLIKAIGFNLERLCQLLCQNQGKVAA